MGVAKLHIKRTIYSLERIQKYLDIEHELKPTEAGIPPAAWPKSGELQVELIYVSRLIQRYYTIFLSININFEQVASSDNLLVADLFTKPLARDHHHRILTALNIR